MRSNFRHLILTTAPVFAVSLLLPIQPAFGQSQNLFLGKWTLDPDKSQFAPGPAPAQRTMILEMKNGSLHHLTDTYGGNGGLSTIDYTAKFDGADYPIEGTAIDTVSLKHIDANTIERTGKVRGMPTETCTMKVSNDGKTLTMTVKGSYYGTNYASTQVYQRE